MNYLTMAERALRGLLHNDDLRGRAAGLMSLREDMISLGLQGETFQRVETELEAVQRRLPKKPGLLARFFSR